MQVPNCQNSPPCIIIEYDPLDLILLGLFLACNVLGTLGEERDVGFALWWHRCSRLAMCRQQAVQKVS